MIYFAFRSDPIESSEFDFDEGLISDISGGLLPDVLQVNLETSEGLKSR